MNQALILGGSTMLIADLDTHDHVLIGCITAVAELGGCTRDDKRAALVLQIFRALIAGDLLTAGQERPEGQVNCVRIDTVDPG